ncbi:MAG: PhzF family phenazine biosynthesis protein [Pseudomonadales bacterium]
MKTYIVDVFAESQLAGNQLAVVMDAATLSSETMQRIARETNFSETTFVTAHHGDKATVRIFTPTKELPFAGHPTVGTAWVLATLESDSPRSNITLQLGVGDVPVRLDNDTGIVWLESPQATFSEGISRDFAARLLSIDGSDLLDDKFPIRSAELGPSFQLIAVKDLDTLGKCRVDSNEFMHFQAEGNGVQGLFVFTPFGHSASSNYAARMFFEADGIREDPATGSANCCFAAYLKSLQINDQKAIVDQGVEMGRPSVIYLNLADPILVGGKVQHVFSGELHL